MRVIPLIRLGVAMGLLIAARSAWAQPAPHGADTDSRRVSAHVLLGGFVPTGLQRRALDPAALIGAQLAVGLRPTLAVVGGVAIAQTSDRSTPASTDVDLVQFDLGVEVRSGAARPERGRIAPFGGIGIGGRRYDHRAGSAATQTVLAGYLAAGVELALWRTGLRVEARDYLSGGHGRAEGVPVRNDLALLAGLAHHFR